MRRVKLFTIDALPYRQPIPVYGYRFGSRKKTLAVMGAIRGDEVQQMYTAARLVRKFSELEAAGAFAPDCGVMVVPCAGQFSMNVSKRFWPLDNTDINRMFPGYGAGETTQRLADRIFTALQGYKWGVHLASFYLPGDFVPHVRIVDTGYQENEEGLDFGLPYLVIRKPHPYDTTTLNYNWQVWETRTFSETALMRKARKWLRTACCVFWRKRECCLIKGLRACNSSCPRKACWAVNFRKVQKPKQ